MKYRIRTGIVYNTIVGEHFLISTGDAVAVCPPIQQINEAASYYWKLLMQEKTTEEMLDIASQEAGVEKEKLQPGLKKFLQGLEERQYIFRVDE